MTIKGLSTALLTVWATKMNDTAKEYGNALFALACESNAKEEYASALVMTEKAFKANPEYADLLSSPNISLAEKLSSIHGAFGSSLPEHVLSFLMLMCEKRRISMLQAAICEYTALLNASNRITDVRVTSAIELNLAEKQRLKLKLEEIYRGEVRLEYTVDSALLGGLIIESDGKITDGSLRRRLSHVKEVIGNERKI